MASIKRRHALYKVSKITDRELDRNIYKNYNNALNKLLRKAKKDYYSRMFESCRDSSLKTWKVIRSIIGGIDKKPCGSEQYQADFNEKLADHFSNAGNEIRQSVSIHQNEGSFHQYIGPGNETSMWLQKTNEREVLTVISGIKNNSAGSDFLSLRVLKEIFYSY